VQDKRKELFDLYKIAIDEYRFNVRLGWDRTRFYLLLTMSITGASLAILRLTSFPQAKIPAVGMLCLGLLVAHIGKLTNKRSHEYYRRSIVQKTGIEKELGLVATGSDDLVIHPHKNIASTRGMEKADEILNSPSDYIHRPLQKGNITKNLQNLFNVLQLANICIISYLVYAFLFQEPVKNSVSGTKTSQTQKPTTGTQGDLRTGDVLKQNKEGSKIEKTKPNTIQMESPPQEARDTREPSKIKK
jgi:hypothetical protein